MKSIDSIVNYVQTEIQLNNIILGLQKPMLGLSKNEELQRLVEQRNNALQKLMKD